MLFVVIVVMRAFVFDNLRTPRTVKGVVLVFSFVSHIVVLVRMKAIVRR